MLRYLKPQKIQSLRGVSQFNSRWFARMSSHARVASMSNDPSIHEPIVPTMAEEFDAHEYKMKVKYENKHETQWYNEKGGREIFRYDPQFPDFDNDYRPTYNKSEEEIFDQMVKSRNNLHENRIKDHFRLVKLKTGGQVILICVHSLIALL